MPPLWLLITPDQMAAIAGGIFFAGAGWVAFWAAAYVNHRASEVESSASEGSPAPFGVGDWAAGSTLTRPEGDQTEGLTSRVDCGRRRRQLTHPR